MHVVHYVYCTTLLYRLQFTVHFVLTDITVISTLYFTFYITLHFCISRLNLLNHMYVIIRQGNLWPHVVSIGSDFTAYGPMW